MPMMNGLELCDRIRNEAAELPFILYTSHERQRFDGRLRRHVLMRTSGRERK
jgi:CheY-like chemotaxis protein